MVPVHPCRFLERERLARDLTTATLAASLRLSPGRISDVAQGRRAVTLDTTLRPARCFGNSARFWMNLQTAHELGRSEAELGPRIAAEFEPAA